MVVCPEIAVGRGRTSMMMVGYRAKGMFTRLHNSACCARYSDNLSSFLMNRGLPRAPYRHDSHFVPVLNQSLLDYFLLCLLEKHFSGVLLGLVNVPFDNQNGQMEVER